MTVKFKPQRDRILIKPIVRKESQLIEVVNTGEFKRKFHCGEVIAIGPGRYERPDHDMRKRPLDVKVGDVVSFGETPVKFPEYTEDGVTYFIIQEGDIAFEEMR